VATCGYLSHAFPKKFQGFFMDIYIYRYRLKLPTSHWNNAFMEGWAIVPG